MILGICHDKASINTEVSFLPLLLEMSGGRRDRPEAPGLRAGRFLRRWLQKTVPCGQDSAHQAPSKRQQSQPGEAEGSLHSPWRRLLCLFRVPDPIKMKLLLFPSLGEKGSVQRCPRVFRHRQELKQQARV